MKRKISSLATLVVVLLVLIVPMFAFTASAAEMEATLSFASTAQRTSFSTSQQVWEQNGIKLINKKSASTTDVGNYSKPARLYAGSSVEIEAPGNITKIVFDCNSTSYATAMKNSIGTSATVSVSSDKVTVTLGESTNSFTVAKLTAQVRLDSLTVTYTTGSSPEPEPSCTHENTTTTNTATCTEAGTETVTCNDCEEVISTKAVSAKGHTYIDGFCSCGEAAPVDTLNLNGKKFYIATKRSSGNYFYMTSDIGTASTKRYTAIDSKLSSLPDSISNPESNKIFVFEYNGDGKYYIYTEGVSGDGKYLGYTDGNSGTLVSKENAKLFTITPSQDGTYTIGFDSRLLALNSTSGNNYFAFYGGSQQKNLTLIPIAAASCSHTNTTTHINSTPTCTADGLKSTICNDCGNLVSSEVIPALGHSLVDEVCIKCNYTDAPVDPVDGSWELVTDVSTLKPGDKIIIVSKESNAALSTNQKDSNRGQASVSKDGNYVTFYYDTQILTLQAGNTEGSFAFYTGNGYLYAASSGSNHLKTETTLSDNGSWIITIEADGTATIKAQGTNKRNWLRYNSSSTGQLFSCYESGQSDVVIYKLEQEGEDPAKLYAASMTVGSNLAMNFYVSGAIGSDYRMTFTINGAVYEVTSSKQSNGYLVFTFANIPPQMMGDTITAKLYKSGSDTVLNEVETSVKEYAEKVIALYPDNEKLMNLIADMLKYGAAAQKYVEYKEDELVTDGIDLTGKGSTADPTTDDNHRSITTAEGTEIDKSVYSFTAAGVRFDFDNKIYIKFKATTDANISLKCNGKYVTKEDLGNGTYIFYTDGIEAYSFDEVYVFELYVDNVLHQTLKYSVNSYAYAKFTDEQTTAVDELALALYRYGLSAKAYTGR